MKLFNYGVDLIVVGIICEKSKTGALAHGKPKVSEERVQQEQMGYIHF